MSIKSFLLLTFSLLTCFSYAQETNEPLTSLSNDQKRSVGERSGGGAVRVDGKLLERRLYYKKIDSIETVFYNSFPMALERIKNSLPDNHRKFLHDLLEDFSKEKDDNKLLFIINKEATK